MVLTPFTQNFSLVLYFKKVKKWKDMNNLCSCSYNFPKHYHWGQWKSSNTHHKAKYRSCTYSLEIKSLGNRNSSENIGIHRDSHKTCYYNRKRIFISEYGFNNIIRYPVMNNCSDSNAYKNKLNNILPRFPCFWKSKFTAFFSAVIGSIVKFFRLAEKFRFKMIFKFIVSPMAGWMM